jgi:ATP phosphoribosyltransferase
MPRIALTKGRLLDESIDWLVANGFDRPAANGRALSVPIGREWEAVLLKGDDVPVFVQNGAADLGVVGSDILDEQEPDVYDLRALGFGACRLSLAAPFDRKPDSHASPFRVATKYPRLAERHLAPFGFFLRIIRVSSSVELAPALGLSDAIVDLVDTGRTLTENGLREDRVLAQIQAHLIANRRSYRFLDPRWWESP